MPTAPGRPLRVGVIGTGFGSSTHIPAFKQSAEFEVVAVVSRRREKAEQVARDASVAWFSDDYRSMLREVDLDVVSIAVPAALHREIVLASAAAGRHILCEKPFATSVAEAQEMLAAVEAAGVGHTINHEFRMIPARQEFRRLVSEGFLGTTFDVRAVQDVGMLLNPARGWSWWSDRNQYGGIMQAFTSHLIDFLLWTFGDIVSVSALTDTFIRTRRAEDGTMREVTSDDQNVSLVRFAAGGTGHIHVSGVYRSTRTLTIEAQGSDGSLSIENNQLLAAREVGKFEPVEPRGGIAEGSTGAVALMTAYLPHVARVFRGGQDDVVATFEQGVRVQAVMDAIHQSSASGGNRVEPATVATTADKTAAGE
jgi:predicted dehydrogenase